MSYLSETLLIIDIAPIGKPWPARAQTKDIELYNNKDEQMLRSAGRVVAGEECGCKADSSGGYFPCERHQLPDRFGADSQKESRERMARLLKKAAQEHIGLSKLQPREK